MYVAVAEYGLIVKIISSPAQMVGFSGEALLLVSVAVVGVTTPISNDVLTLFDISGSSGIVILAVKVYGPEGLEKSKVDVVDPTFGTKSVGYVSTTLAPAARLYAASGRIV